MLSVNQVQNVIDRFRKMIKIFEEETVIAITHCSPKREVICDLLEQLPTVFAEQIFIESDNVPKNLSALENRPPPPPPPVPRPRSVSQSPRSEVSTFEKPMVPLNHDDNPRFSTFRRRKAQDPIYPYPTMIEDSYGYLLDNETNRVWCRISYKSKCYKRLNDSHIAWCFSMNYPVYFSNNLPEHLSLFLDEYSEVKREFVPVFEQKENLCSVCHQAGPDKKVYCGHKFHKGCIETWTKQLVEEKKDFTCPVCREVI